jgi:hypothetical protein
MRTILKTLMDPATNVGTARWVALGVTAYDAMRHGVSLANGAVLLVLAGVDIAARYFDQRQPPTMPPAVPA